jgi:hypothetical protein
MLVNVFEYKIKKERILWRNNEKTTKIEAIINVVVVFKSKKNTNNY